MLRKIKVLIVDDEFLIRNLLKLRIPWNELDMEVVAEASSAEEAMNIIDSNLPDIILTDICMPFMNGIELSKNIKAKYPNIKILIISGHDDFEYAKKSIKIGVSDYILKPIIPEDIKSILSEIKTEILIERQANTEIQILKNNLDDNLNILRKNFIDNLFSTTFDRNDIYNKILFLKLNITDINSIFQVSIVSIISDNINNINLLYDNISNITKTQNNISTLLYDNNKVLIISNNKYIDFISFNKDLHINLQNSFKQQIYIGIGNTYLDIYNLKESYKEALSTLNYLILTNFTSILYFGDIDHKNDTYLLLNTKTFDKLLLSIKNGLEDKIDPLIDELFNNIIFTDIDKLKLETFNIISKIQDLFTESKTSNTNFNQIENNPYYSISQLIELPEIIKYLKKLSITVMLEINPTQNKKVSKLINNIKKYIEDNICSGDISLSSVAKEFYISPSHLSRLFKNETNCTFIEYVTRVRMELSIKLLKETDLRVYQIAEKIGVDPHYLSIVFKKYTGISINDFRKQ